MSTRPVRLRRRGVTIAELIASLAVASIVVGITSQLVVTSRSANARNALRQKANEQLLNVLEQISALPFAELDEQASWSELLIPTNDAALSTWDTSVQISDFELESDEQLQSKRVLIQIKQDTRQNPIRVEAVTWRFSNDSS